MLRRWKEREELRIAEIARSRVVGPDADAERGRAGEHSRARPRQAHTDTHRRRGAFLIAASREREARKHGDGHHRQCVRTELPARKAHLSTEFEPCPDRQRRCHESGTERCTGPADPEADRHEGAAGRPLPPARPERESNRHEERQDEIRAGGIQVAVVHVQADGAEIPDERQHGRFDAKCTDPEAIHVQHGRDGGAGDNRLAHLHHERRVSARQPPCRVEQHERLDQPGGGVERFLTERGDEIVREREVPQLRSEPFGSEPRLVGHYLHGTRRPDHGNGRDHRHRHPIVVAVARPEGAADAPARHERHRQRLRPRGAGIPPSSQPHRDRHDPREGDQAGARPDSRGEGAGEEQRDHPHRHARQVGQRGEQRQADERTGGGRKTAHGGKEPGARHGQRRPTTA